MQTTINGKSVTFSPRADTAAIEVIREVAGLTGTKLVCGAGVCGACTVLVDGRPMTSCLLPAHSMEGKSITTIEGQADGSLHPIQKAFLAHDGLQCGFCTPGFINEAVAFFDDWRAEHGTTAPGREAIAASLAGHLCRCGAHVGIYDAVARACAGDFDAATTVLPPRVEATDKVTGAARYTVDIRLPGTLIGKLYRSPHAHARVLRIDTTVAKAHPGVHAVIDILEDAHRTVRFRGQPILAIAADTEAIALAAMQKIVIEYDVRPFVTTLDLAQASQDSLVYPEAKKQPRNASEGPIPPGSWDNNVRTPYLNILLSKGKSRAEKRVRQARSNPDTILVEHTFRSPGQTHTVLEPHNALAHWTPDDKLTLYVSSQAVYGLANKVAKQYKLKREDVTVLSEHIGGGFGSKLGFNTEARAAIELSRATHRPVHLTYDRQEEMELGGYRPLTKIELNLVAKKDGTAQALTAKAYGDCGIAVQSQVTPWLRWTYAGMAKSLQDFDVVTNAAPACPFRAPSGPPAFWALESAVDEVAHRTGIDPIDLRRKWDDSDIRHNLYDWAEALPAWKNRKAVNTDTGRYKTGIGLAIGNWFNAYDSTSGVEISSSPEGLQVRSATQDMGNGVRSVIAKAVGGVLGIESATVPIEIGDSSYQKGPTCGGSRATNSVYAPAIEATQKLIDHWIGAGTKDLQWQEARWEAGGIRHSKGFEPLDRLLRDMPAQTVSAVRGSNGTFDILGKLPSGEISLNLYPRMTGAVYVAAVRVDTRLGRVEVEKIWGGLSVGKIVNPVLARSQAYGGAIQSMGFTLYEERIMDPLRGALLTHNMEDYRIPGIGDIPEIEIHFDETGMPGVKGQACGMSELSTLAIAPAIGNAVFHATGWRPTELPLTPQRVLPNVS